MRQPYYHRPTDRMKTLSPQQWKVLQALRAAGSRGVTGDEFRNINVNRYSSRIGELVHDFGFDISDVERVSEGVYVWRLLAEPSVPPRRDASVPLGDRQPARDGVRASRREGAEGTLFELDPEPTTVSAITGRRAA